MSMNKKEEAELYGARVEAARAKALRWSDYEPVKIDPKDYFGGGKPFSTKIIPAWTYHTYTMFQSFGSNGPLNAVCEGCFSATGHCSTGSKKTTTQGQGGPWYASKRDALIALRQALELSFSIKLAAIDEAIAHSKE